MRSSLKVQNRFIPSWNDSLLLRTVHLVFTPKNRMPIFEDSLCARDILVILGQAAKRHAIVMHEACAMPDHVHLLLSFDRSRHLERDVMKKLKGASARAFLAKRDRKIPHLWGTKKHCEEVQSERQFNATLAYIQRNPVEAHIPSGGRLLSDLRLQAACCPDHEE